MRTYAYRAEILRREIRNYSTKENASDLLCGASFERTKNARSLAAADHTLAKIYTPAVGDIVVLVLTARDTPTGQIYMSKFSGRHTNRTNDNAPPRISSFDALTSHDHGKIDFSAAKGGQDRLRGRLLLAIVKKCRS